MEASTRAPGSAGEAEGRYDLERLSGPELAELSDLLLRPHRTAAERARRDELLALAERQPVAERG